MQALSLGTTFSWPEASLLLIFLNLDISCSWQLIRLTSLFLKISFRWCFFVLPSVSVNAFIVPPLFHGIYLFVMKYLSVSVKISSVDNSFLWHLLFFASLRLDISDTRVLHLRCASPATSSFRNSFTSVCSRYAFAYSRYVQQPSWFLCTMRLHLHLSTLRLLSFRWHHLTLRNVVLSGLLSFIQLAQPASPEGPGPALLRPVSSIACMSPGTVSSDNTPSGAVLGASTSITIELPLQRLLLTTGCSVTIASFTNYTVSHVTQRKRRAFLGSQAEPVSSWFTSGNGMEDCPHFTSEGTLSLTSHNCRTDCKMDCFTQKLSHTPRPCCCTNLGTALWLSSAKPPQSHRRRCRGERSVRAPCSHDNCSHFPISTHRAQLRKCGDLFTSALITIDAIKATRLRRLRRLRRQRLHPACTQNQPTGMRASAAYSQSNPPKIDLKSVMTDLGKSVTATTTKPHGKQDEVVKWWISKLNSRYISVILCNSL